MKNDLLKRLLVFGIEIVEFSQKLGQTVEVKAIRSQLSRSATSVGANYYESQSATSRKDFINKIQISLKELRETQYWLQMIQKLYIKGNVESGQLINQLMVESEELRKILVSIILTAKKNS